RDAPVQAQALLGASMQAITNPPPSVSGAVSALIKALQSLGVVVPDPHGGFGVSADAFAAIVTDAASFFRTRLRGALDAVGVLAGLSGPSGGPWKFATPELPFEVFLEQNPWRLGLRTSGSSGLSLGGGASLIFNANVALPNFAPSLDATVKIGALN